MSIFQVTELRITGIPYVVVTSSCEFCYRYVRALASPVETALKNTKQVTL